MTDTVSVAIVTGGAQGLGEAICRALLKKGSKVCVADIQEVKGKQLVEELQGTYGSENVMFSVCDVTKESHYKNTFDSTLNAFGKVDILVNNAGIVMEQNPRQLIEVNLMGPIIGCQTALKYMGKSNGGNGGIVINTASALGVVPVSYLPVYTATKHGVVGVTRSYGLPYHLEKDGIIFAAICPSFIDTEVLRNSRNNSAVSGIDFTQHPDVMSPDYVAQGAMKILEDRINGSTLVITKNQGYKYVTYQEVDFPVE